MSPPSAHPPSAGDPSPLEPRDDPFERLAILCVFVGAALRYWLVVHPVLRLELRRWQGRAQRIPDPALRRAALDALLKRPNIEGAAAFAAIARGRRRLAVLRAVVAFQAIYDYVDTLAERSSGDPQPDARCLHDALMAALEPDAPQRDYYAGHAHRDDGGYLVAMVQACRAALAQLPSYQVVAVPARRSAARIVAFQSLSLGAHGGLARWARTQVSASSALAWWEIAAACGSSLEVHSLIAAAAVPSLRVADVTSIEGAYFPWIGALHSLLDSIVDQAEDAATGQLSLIACYRSKGEATTRMHQLARQARQAARALPDGRRHAVLTVAMACHYLSELETSPAGASSSAPDPSGEGGLAPAELARAVRDAMGSVVAPTLTVFRVRRTAGRLAEACTRLTSWMRRRPTARTWERAVGGVGEGAPAVLVEQEKPSANARAA